MGTPVFQHDFRRMTTYLKELVIMFLHLHITHSIWYKREDTAIKYSNDFSSCSFPWTCSLTSRHYRISSKMCVSGRLTYAISRLSCVLWVPVDVQQSNGLKHKSNTNYKANLPEEACIAELNEEKEKKKNWRVPDWTWVCYGVSSIGLHGDMLQF